jgi:hypothetical protein
MGENGNKVFQLMFWVMSGICMTGIILLSQSVIANDRLRSNEDEKLRDKLSYCMDGVNNKLDVITNKVTRIEVKLNLEYGK